MHIVWYFKVPPDDSEVQPGLRKTLAWNNYYTVVYLYFKTTVSPLKILVPAFPIPTPWLRIEKLEMLRMGVCCTL